MANKAYGLSADCERKMASKRDPALEREAFDFIAQHTGQRLHGNWEALKDGVVLCDLVSAFQSGIAKPNRKSKMPFVKMENIGQVVSALKKLGVADMDCFMTVDLYEEKNLAKVVQSLLALKRARGGGGRLAPGVAKTASKGGHVKGGDMYTSHAVKSTPKQDTVKSNVRYGKGGSPSRQHQPVHSSGIPKSTFPPGGAVGGGGNAPKFCPECGKNVPTRVAKFCQECGHKF